MNSAEILSDLKNSFLQILDTQLVGLYVHGSLAFGCYHPVKSDIDLIAVVDRDITPEQKKRIIREVIRAEAMGPEKGIEMSVVKAEVCSPFRFPTPFLLHYSKAHTAWAMRDLNDYCARMNGTDPDLAAHFTVLNTVGQVLFGKPIADVFAPVPQEDYLASLRFDIENAEEDILTNPVYITLNLCRVAAYLRHGLVLSKKSGGEWGMTHLPERFHSLIFTALQAYHGYKQPDAAYEGRKEFASYMLSSILPVIDEKITSRPCNE